MEVPIRPRFGTLGDQVSAGEVPVIIPGISRGSGEPSQRSPGLSVSVIRPKGDVSLLGTVPPSASELLSSVSGRVTPIVTVLGVGQPPTEDS